MKSEIVKLSEGILSRIYPNPCRQTDPDDECLGEVNQSVTLKRPVEDSINSFLVELQDKISNSKILKAKISTYESANRRTKDLDPLFDALTTGRPTSLPSERVFPIYSHFLIRIRSSLSNLSVDVFYFIKTYFLKRESK